ncbi:MAG TPA: two-component regulator propeller domain-containing protein [Flavisolibacter sp.]|nr:two-component regulator propeller domain-containing protein [Flavisolibacter sp.]
MTAAFAYRLCRVLMLVLLPLCGNTQLPVYALNRIQEEGGLATADVLNMARDSKGFLWVATQSSVYGFDGRHVLRFTFSEAVTRVFIDSRQRKWVSTRDAIYLFEENTGRFDAVRLPGQARSGMPTLYQLKDSTVRALRRGQHFVFDETKQSFLASPLSFAGNMRLTQYLGSHGRYIFYGNSDTLVRYHTSSGAVNIIPFKNLYHAFVLTEDEMLVSSHQYLSFRINFSTGAAALLGAPPYSRFGEKLVCYSRVAFDSDNLLVASNKGLFQYNTQTGAITKPVFYYQGRPFDNQASVSSMYKDKEGTVYMNSADGIFMLSKNAGFIQQVRNYQFGNESLPGNDVRNFTEDAQGNIWLCTTSGIACLNPVNGSLRGFTPLSGRGLVDYPSYRQLMSDGNLLWIGTSGNGVWYYEKESGICRRPAFASPDSSAIADFEQAYIWKLVRLKSGELLAVSNRNFYLIDPRTLKATLLAYSLSSGASRSALQDHSGRIWHGSTVGLTCFDSNFRPLFSLRDSLPDKRVAAFCEWKKDHMLIGSRGLFELRLQDGKPLSFERKKAIPAEQFIYCMKQDGEGIVWLGTDNGIYRYDPLKDEATKFDASDGVQSQAFNSDAAFLKSDGTMYMGGKNGFNYFRPEAYKPSASSLQPFVLSFAVTIGDSLYSRLPASIPYHGRNLDFIISAPELNKPMRIQYRYRLKSGEDKWNYTGFTNHIRISSLQPGDYGLQVAASYDGKTWFDGGETVFFTIQPPWWQTWWFAAICAAVLALASWRWSVYRRHRREASEMKRMMDYFSYAGSADASVDLILWDIARNCISRMGFEDCVIYLLDEKRGMLIQKAAYGAKSPALFEIANPIEIPLGQGITGYVAQTGQALIVPDTTKDQRYIVDDAARLSEMAVPLIHDGRVIGVIDSEHSKKRFFTLHHLKTLQTVASICASKIATAMALDMKRKAEEEIILLNGKMTEAKFANLRLQMNPHFLFNILTTIQYLIISNQVNKATKYLDIFSGFLRSLLDHAEDSVVTLEEELRILSLYVELESLCMDETFECSIEVADEIDAEDVTVPFMLLQPFVENAIHHGLIRKAGQKRFSIKIEEQEDNSILCTIEDNGIGRAASSSLNGRTLSNKVHQSKGIGIVEERLALLQQKTGKKACFSIEDLEQNGVPSGTRVNISIPDYLTEDI